MRSATDTARLALACLDLTSLNDGDGEADIARLCERAATPHGAVAAVCVWPRLAAFARTRAPEGVAVAAVANFPDGADDLQRALRDAGTIADAGAQEVDLVLPWRTLLSGDEAACAALVRAVRRASRELRLKLILESGELKDAVAIGRAARIGLAEGADFLKTSTGKTPVGATPEAARTMLEAIAESGTRCGFKASGGVRTVADAAVYADLVASILGPAALGPGRFRIGASGLLADIESVLGGHAAAPQTGSY